MTRMFTDKNFCVNLWNLREDLKREWLTDDTDVHGQELLCKSVESVRRSNKNFNDQDRYTIYESCCKNSFSRFVAVCIYIDSKQHRIG